MTWIELLSAEIQKTPDAAALQDSDSKSLHGRMDTDMTQLAGRNLTHQRLWKAKVHHSPRGFRPSTGFPEIRSHITITHQSLQGPPVLIRPLLYFFHLEDVFVSVDTYNIEQGLNFFLAAQKERNKPLHFVDVISVYAANVLSGNWGREESQTHCQERLLTATNASTLRSTREAEGEIRMVP